MNCETFDSDKKHKRVFGLLSFSILSYLVLSYCLVYLLSFLLKKYNISINETEALILSVIIQYGIGLIPTFIILGRIKPSRFVKTKLKFFDFFKLFCIAMAFMYIGSSLSNAVMNALENVVGSLSSDPLQDIFNETSLYVSFAFTCILGPIIEELIFRKMLIDRLDAYGDKIAILFSSLLFSLHHLNFYQFIYAFTFGLILAYIYEKTHRLIYTVIIHALANLIFGFIPVLLTSNLDMEKLLNTVLSGDYSYATEKILNVLAFDVYSLFYMSLAILGVVFFFLGRKRIFFKKGEIVLPKDNYLNIVLFNVGTVVFIVASLVYSAFVLVS